jgi:hypothetical protein
MADVKVRMCQSHFAFYLRMIFSIVIDLPTQQSLAGLSEICLECSHVWEESAIFGIGPFQFYSLSRLSAADFEAVCLKFKEIVYFVRGTPFYLGMRHGNPVISDYEGLQNLLCPELLDCQASSTSSSSSSTSVVAGGDNEVKLLEPRDV